MLKRGLGKPRREPRSRGLQHPPLACARPTAQAPPSAGYFYLIRFPNGTTKAQSVQFWYDRDHEKPGAEKESTAAGVF